MKHYQLFYFLLFFIILLCSSLHPFELGLDFHLGNLAFSPEREITETDFTGTDYYNWGLSLNGEHQINDKLVLSSSFYGDPVLRNISCSHVTYKENIFSIGIGPVFGFLNSGINPIIKPGISAILRIEVPSIIFLEFRADSSLNSRLSVDQDYIQERSDISVGFYVPHAICRVNILSTSFTQLRLVSEGGEDMFYDYVDSLMEYSFHANIFKKNVPYRINISFAYHMLGKSYIKDTERTEHNLNSFILGTGIELDFSPAIHFTLDVESSIYTFGEEELVGITNPGPMGYMFKASTGIVLNINKLIQGNKLE
jgi:hypothetical protein